MQSIQLRFSVFHAQIRKGRTFVQRAIAHFGTVIDWKPNAFGLQRYVLRWRRWEGSISQNRRRKCWCEFTNIRRHQRYRGVFPQIISRLTCTVRNKFMNGPKFLVLVNIGCTLMWCYRKLNPPATLSTWVSTAMLFKCTTCTVAPFRHRYASSTVATFPNALAIWFIDRLSALSLQNLCVLVTCLVGRTQIHVDVYYDCQYCSTWCTAFTPA